MAKKVKTKKKPVAKPVAKPLKKSKAIAGKGSAQRAKKKDAPAARKAVVPVKKSETPAFRGGKKPGAEPRPAIMPTALHASGIVLKEGQAAPAFELPSDLGERVSLVGLRGKRVVLYFYPKDDTPGCTQEACDFRDSFARIQGAVVLGVSKDTVEQHKKFKAKYSLPFALLADVSGKTLLDYGVWKEKSMYGRSYMGIERTTFLIDEAGVIRKIYPKVSVPGHVDQVLKDLKSI